MNVKEHLSIDEQIILLRSRGCLIEDENEVHTVLRDVNYYRLASYFLPFKESEDKYIEGTTFNKVYRNYLFDRKLRNMISYIIEYIEVMIKTKIAYFHSKKYGPLGYLNGNNYNAMFDEGALQEKISKCLERNKSNPIIIHHCEKYQGHFPLWVIIEFFDFGFISKMYYQLDTQLQKEISKSLNVKHDKLSSWLYCLTHLRNCCAHYARIYNTHMISIPKTPKNYSFKFTKTLFSYLLVMKELLCWKTDWKNFVIELEALIEEYSEDIDLNRMGFPTNWRELLL
ncbi:MAG: Abi family protein [Bacilli bacterium]|nr:Abi family protein [Bacilli bacterium]